MATCRPTMRARASAGCQLEVVTALAAVLRLFPEGSDQFKAAASVVDAGAVPALVDVIRVFTHRLQTQPGQSQQPSPTVTPPTAAKKDVNTEPAASTSSCCCRCCCSHCQRSPRALGAGGTKLPLDHRSCDSVTTSTAAPDAEAWQADGDVRIEVDVDVGSAWDAFGVLERLMAVGAQPSTTTAAAAVTSKAAAHALASGAISALLPLLSLPPPRNDHSWRALRLLLALERAAAAAAASSSPAVATTAAGDPADVDAGGGVYSSTFSTAAAVAAASGSGDAAPRLLQSLSSAGPAAVQGFLLATRELLSSPHALTDATAEVLLEMYSELLAGSSLVTPEALRRVAPALAEVAAGVLIGTSPGPSWSALLPCARERAPQPTRGLMVRYSVQLEAAGALVTHELLTWASALEEARNSGSGGGGTEGGVRGGAELEDRVGWRRWLPVTPVAVALLKRWLGRPGVFEALGEAGMKCLTLALKLAPPEELWASDRVEDIPRLARKVRSLLERHRLISAWQLALAAAASAAVGSRRLPPGTAAAIAGAAPVLSTSPPQTPGIPDPVSPRQAAEELVTHVTSLMASVKLSKLGPLERLGILATALNAAVACIDPWIGPSGGGRGSASGGTSALQQQQQQLLRAMSAVLARLHMLLAAAVEAAQDGHDGQPAASGARRPGRGTGAKAGSGAAGGRGDGEAEDEDPMNGSFRGVELAELLPVVAAAQRVAASAAALVGRGLGPGGVGE